MREPGTPEQMYYRDHVCTKWTVACADFSGVHSRQSRPFRQWPHSLVRTTNLWLWQCCSPRASPYRVAWCIATKFRIMAMSQDDNWDPGQWCRQLSTNSRTGMDGWELEMPLSSAVHSTCRHCLMPYMCALIASSYGSSAVLITTVMNQVC